MIGIETKCFNATASQCFGMSPNDATPDGLRGGLAGRPAARAAARAAAGGRPRVTVREMSAVRFSFSRSIISRWVATNRSTRPVSRSRNAAMERCSARGGSAKRALRMSSRTKTIRVVPEQTLSKYERTLGALML